MFNLVGKADLLSDHFNSEQCRESADLPLTCLCHLVLSPLFQVEWSGISC